MMATRSKFKVIILDDETNMEAAIAANLPKPIRRFASAINPDDIASMVKELGNRAAAVRSSGKRAQTELSLDTADLFIVDYDLVKAKNEDYLTGETIAYLARCYSSCGVVVALNQFCRRPTFDLTLRLQLDSFADINIAAGDLKNAGLWKNAPWKGYRPWSWPVITDLVSLLEKRVQDVRKGDPKMRVVDFFDLPTSTVERLPTAGLELLGSQTSKADAATLGDVLRSPILGLRGREATDRRAASIPSRSIDCRGAYFAIRQRTTVLVDAIRNPRGERPSRQRQTRLLSFSIMHRASDRPFGCQLHHTGTDHVGRSLMPGMAR
jgi:hypothetical protein